MNTESIIAGIYIGTITLNKLLVVFSLVLILRSIIPLLSRHTWFELPDFLTKKLSYNWFPKTDPTIIIILGINIFLLIKTQKIGNYWHLASAIAIILVCLLSLIIVFNRYRFDNLIKNKHYNLNIKSKLYNNDDLSKKIFEILVSEKKLVANYQDFEKLQASQVFDYENRLMWIDVGEKNNTNGNKQSLYALLTWLFPKSSPSSIIRIITECFVKSDNKAFTFTDKDLNRYLNRKTTDHKFAKILDNIK